MQHPRHLYSLGKIIALGSAFALMIVSMVPWGIATNAAGEKILVAGLRGDGKITIILGALAVIFLILKKIPDWLIISLRIIILVLALLVVYNFVIADKTNLNIWAYISRLGVLTISFLALKKNPHWIVLILGFITIFIGTIDLIAVMKATQTVSGYVGYGLYVTVISGIGIVLGTLIEMLKKKG